MTGTNQQVSATADGKAAERLRIYEDVRKLVKLANKAADALDQSERDKQGLAKGMEALKKENEALKAENAALEAENASIAESQKVMAEEVAAANKRLEGMSLAKEKPAEHANASANTKSAPATPSPKNLIPVFASATSMLQLIGILQQRAEADQHIVDDANRGIPSKVSKPGDMLALIHSVAQTAERVARDHPSEPEKAIEIVFKDRYLRLVTEEEKLYETTKRLLEVEIRANCIEGTVGPKTKSGYSGATHVAAR